jgi:hypothetical protein
MIFSHLALLDAPVNILYSGGVVHAALGRAQVHTALQPTQLGLVDRIDEILHQREGCYLNKKNLELYYFFYFFLTFYL